MMTFNQKILMHCYQMTKKSYLILKNLHIAFVVMEF